MRRQIYSNSTVIRFTVIIVLIVICVTGWRIFLRVEERRQLGAQASTLHLLLIRIDNFKKTNENIHVDHENFLGYLYDLGDKVSELEKEVILFPCPHVSNTNEMVLFFAEDVREWTNRRSRTAVAHWKGDDNGANRAIAFVRKTEVEAFLAQWETDPGLAWKAANQWFQAAVDP